nr:MAG TPA: hypothetical protein [Inoviridae sp.]
MVTIQSHIMNNRKIYDIYKSTSLSQNKFTDKDVHFIL